VARLLDPSALAAYFLAFSVVTVAAAAARLGLPRVVVRLVSASMAVGRPGEARDAIRRVALTAGAASAVVVVIVGGPPGRWLARSVFHSNLMAGVMFMAALWAAAEALRYVLSEAFRGFQDFRLAAVLGDAARGALTLAAMAALLLLREKTSLSVVVGASLAASALTAVVAGGFLVRRVEHLGPAQRLNLGVTSIALPLMVVDLAGLLLNQADLWVVGASRRAADIAVYGAAGRVAILLAVPLFVVNAVLAPVAAELHVKAERDELETTLRGASTLATVPTLLFFVAVLFAGGPIMGLVFGPFARSGGAVLAILAIGQVFAVATGACMITLMMTGHQRAVMVASVVVLGLTVPGLLLAADRAGLTAIAAVSSAGTVAQNVLLTLWARRVLGIWTHASLSPAAMRRFLRVIS
jgi:O-antigen/teichoic acid export membrane protein